MSWTNRAVYSIPRNGQTFALIAWGDPTSDSQIVDGAPFIPTPGRLLVMVVSGATTSTTPAGWTDGGSAVGATGLYVWHRAADDAPAVFIMRGARNHPAIVDLYEFEEGTTFLDAAAMAAVANGAPGPTLADAQTVIHASSVAITSPDERTATWASGPADTMLAVPQAATPGIAYTTRIGTGAAETVTWSPDTTSERLGFAVTTPGPAFPDHTPPERTTTIPLEDRTSTITSEDRSMRVAYEDRSHPC